MDQPIRRALISVSDKTGLEHFVRELFRITPGLEVLSTGGTAQLLSAAGLPVTEVSAYTGSPECFGGRIKTLHPFIEGGILQRRGIDDAEAQALGIKPIDLVVCNLYPFEDAARKGVADNELLEQIDIGGLTMIRAAAKNHASVAVVISPGQYHSVLAVMNNGAVPVVLRKELALAAFAYAADYDCAIVDELYKRAGNEMLRLAYGNGQRLRYGENPHQQAWVLQDKSGAGIAHAIQLCGKELSYNNYVDVDAAFKAVIDLLHFGPHGTAIVKHNNPCGYATGRTLVQSFMRAWQGDPISAFGSVIACSSPVDMSLAGALQKQGSSPAKFVEVIIAPSFESEFVAWAKDKKRDLRLLQLASYDAPLRECKEISGGLLVQTPDNALLASTDIFKPAYDFQGSRIGIVTKTMPDPGIARLCAFAMTAVKHLKSNAIVIAQEDELGCYSVLGMGAGQPNRIVALEQLALPKAIQNLRDKGVTGYRAHLSQCIMASDAFFPFDDCVRVAAAHGIKTIIQPGGSKNDKASEVACDELGVAMIYTGRRHFRH
ncbi:bifunctional phosphoribosylaminoimidazolecarboxamide formyltransferase/IMP cyclohydrolase [Candidatus Woesearchaeota archaeon]|nr:bifunctional phosphoribosylaminoimidazolecarboxamide formyltransferase/IMP cyclohydrolase [Candidatus Woesearchaeota archaeon]